MLRRIERAAGVSPIVCERTFAKRDAGSIGYRLLQCLLRRIDPGEIARDAFREWAEPIPKPLAIFAANDLFARQIAVLCDLAHVRVPDEIAIL